VAQLTVTLPDIPDLEALRSGRPAASGAAVPLMQAPGYTLGLRCLRTHTQPFTLINWRNDLVPYTAETRRVLYRPSPLATRLWVGVWYGANWITFGAPSSPPPKTELGIAVVVDATLTTLPGASSNLVLPSPALASEVGGMNAVDWLPVIPSLSNSGLNVGDEQFACTAWDGFDISGLNGLDAWVTVQAEGVAVSAVAWVELVSEVLP
jgi:hypothetical protein